MKNKEKYAEQIAEIACENNSFCIDKDTGAIVSCSSLSCNDCSFYTSIGCDKSRTEWAESEYVERPVISKRDRAFLDYIGDFYTYVVRDSEGKLYVCKDVHSIGNRWFSNGGVSGYDYTYIFGFDVQFPMVNIISSTAWIIKDLKKLEVVEEY